MKPMTQAVAIAAGMAAGAAVAYTVTHDQRKVSKTVHKMARSAEKPWPTSTAWSSTTPAERANKQTRRRSLSRLHRRVCFWGAFGGKRRPHGAAHRPGRPAL